MRLTVDAAGVASCYMNGAKLIEVTDSALATAGALASGGYGIYDNLPFDPSPGITRQYDNFTVAASVADNNPALWTGRDLILRHSGALTNNSSGTAYGPTPIREGRYLTLPPKTRNNSRTRIAVKARRQDVDEGFTDTGTADTLTASLQVTPRVHLTSP
jgi:hypothetical protein